MFNGLILTAALIVKAKRLNPAALLLLSSDVIPESQRGQLWRRKLIMPNLETNDSSSNAGKRRRQTSLSSWLPPSEKKKDSSYKQKDSSYIIYCDLDGVLVDFDAGVRKLCRGKGPKEIEKSSTMWKAIAKAERFYYHLPWTSDGKMLWNSIRHMSPNILTGVPMFKESRQDKAEWCKRELGLKTNHVDMAGPKGSHEAILGKKVYAPHTVNVITCWSRNKHLESGVKSVLIDDRIELSVKWTEKGGIFIHHTDTKSTLQKLVDRGILLSPSVDLGCKDVPGQAKKDTKSTLQKLDDKETLLSPSVDLGCKDVPGQAKKDVLCCVIKGNDDVPSPSSKVLASSEQSPNS